MISTPVVRLGLDRRRQSPRAAAEQGAYRYCDRGTDATAIPRPQCDGGLAATYSR